MLFRIFCSAILLLPLCAAPPDAAARARLKALVDGAAPAGAKPAAEPIVHGSETLYQYMDGAADVFHNYDVQALYHQDFAIGAIELTADLFDMGTADLAFGIYAAERSPGYRFLSIGAEAYANEGILNLFQDRYYVKLAAFGEGADAALAAYARALAARLPGEPRFPALLRTLPAESRVARSEKYLRPEPFGHPFLSPAYQATYELAGQPRQLLISVAPNASEARARLAALETHFRKTGAWAAAPAFGPAAQQGRNSFEGALVAALAGRYVVLLLNPTPECGTFFQDISGRLAQESAQ